MAKKRIRPVPQIPEGTTAADTPSLTQAIISPPTQILSGLAATESLQAAPPPETEQAPTTQEEQESPSLLPQRLQRLRQVPDGNALIQRPEVPASLNRKVSLPNMAGEDLNGVPEKTKQGFKIAVPPSQMNGVQKLADQRKKESEGRSLVSKVFERPISGTVTFLGALINAENMGDVPEIMHQTLDGTAAENNERILEKGLRGFGAVFTVPANFIMGAAGAEDPFSEEALSRGSDAALRNFAQTFSIDDYLVYDALAKDPSIMGKPEEIEKLRRDFTESGYDLFIREMEEGRQVSDEKLIAFGLTSAITHTAEFVFGGGGISKSAQFVIKTTTGLGKAGLGAIKFLYKAPIKTKDGIKTILNLARGGRVREGVDTAVVKLNPVAIHEMKNLVSQRNLHSARLEVFRTELSSLSKNLEDLKATPSLNKDVFEEMSKRFKAVQDKEAAIKRTMTELDKDIISRFGADHKKLNEMLDFTDSYKATAKQMRQNLKAAEKRVGKITKQELEEASILAKNANKHIKNLRKEQNVQFTKDFDITPERVGQLRDVWFDLLSVAKGRKDIKDIIPVTQQLFIKGRGISKGLKSDPVLIKVQNIFHTVPPSKRFEPLKSLFEKTIKDKTKVSVPQLDELSANLKSLSNENDEIVTQINTTVSDAIARATNKITEVEKAALDQAIQIRGGVERLRQVSIDKFGKDITQLSRKQIRELAKPLDADLDEMISVRDLIVSENKFELDSLKAMFKKVFNVDIKNFDRADMMNRSREFELLKRNLDNIGKNAAKESSTVRRIQKDFIEDYGITPQQFQQVEQFASDIHKTPWMQRFTPEFSDKLDYFATLTGGVKYRQFRSAVKAVPSKTVIPSPKFLRTQLIKDTLRTLRSHEARLQSIGGSADEILQRITRRDEEARRASGIWKETLRESVKDLSDDEIKAMRIAMKNDDSVDKMMASISQFGTRIRSGVVVEAAEKTRDLLDEIFVVADDVGVNVAGFRKEYFPVVHKYSDMFTNERTREAFIDKLMREGVEMSQQEFDFLLVSNQINTADPSALAAYSSDFADLMADLTKRSAGTVRHKFTTREQASKILEGLGIARGSRASKNLTLSRHGEGLPGAIADPLESLNTYIERAANTVNDQVWFTGAKEATQDQQIRELISKLGREDHRQEVASIFNDIINAPKPLLKQKQLRASATIRALNTPKLAFMAINNSAQGFLGTLWATDFSVASKAFLGAFKSKNREFARRAGAVFENMEMQMANESGVNSALSAPERLKIWQTRFLKWNGAAVTEIHNRTTAALGGKFQVEHIAERVRQGAVLSRKEQRLIKELVFEKSDDFINNIKTGLYDSNPEKWHNVLQIAGQRLARRSQLDPSGIFTRGFTNSPLGSILLQYKSFALNHAKFMWQQLNPRRFIDEVLTDPALTKVQKGRAFADYMNKVLAYQVSGELVGDVRTGIINLWRDDKIERPEDWERIIQNFMYVGGLGIVSDIANIAINGNKYRAMSTLLGPSGSDLATLAPVFGGNMSEKASVVIEKIPIPIVNKALADMAQGK